MEIKAKKERLHYVDVSKGLLALMVVLSHLQNVAVSLDIENTLCKSIDSLEVFWCPFFMPAFFILTGFCSNFNKEFKSFLISNFKTLIIPSIFLAFIVRWINGIADGVTTPQYYMFIGMGIIKTCGNWFLPALFVSKIVYWFLNKYVKSIYIIAIITIVLFYLGYFLYTFVPSLPNLWSWKYGILFVCLLL